MNIGATKLGRYKIVDILFQGGEGFTAKARDETTGKDVAIKELVIPRQDAAARTRIARFERAGTLRINHPNVVDPIDFGEDGGAYYLVTPFIDGASLDRLVQDHSGRLSYELVQTILIHVASGLEAIHAHQIVHRDCKPGNILIDLQGTARIIDFGICRNIHENTVTSEHGLLGTLSWMSPEQLTDAQKVDARSDLYSLGVIAYVLLTGHSPVGGTATREIVTSILQHTPPSPRSLNPSVPAHLDQVCMNLLVKEPRQRVQSAAEVVQRLGQQQSAGRAAPPAAVDASPAAFCVSCGVRMPAGGCYCVVCGASANTARNHEPHCLACGTAVGRQQRCPGCHRVFSAENHRLVFRTGPLTGFAFRIPQGQFEVGRDTLRGLDQHISRRHLTVQSCNGQVQVHDAGSANHTFIGGQRIASWTLLHAGCEIRIAGNTATYLKN